MGFVGNGDVHDYSGSAFASASMTYSTSTGNKLAFLVFGVPQGTPVEGGVTITDTGGSTIVHPTGAYANDGAGNYAWLFYCNSAIASTSFTIALNNGTQTGCTFPLAILAEYSGWGNFVTFAGPNFQATPGTGANAITSGTVSVAASSNVWGSTVSYNSPTGTEVISAGTSPISFTSDYYQSSSVGLNQYMIEHATAPSTASDAATFGSTIGTIPYVTGMLNFAAATFPTRRLVRRVPVYVPLFRR